MPAPVASRVPTRIAILGAGFAGATAAIALGKLQNLEIDLFDQAKELREIGASIALQPCALRCLEKLGLREEVDEIAYRHGPYPLTHRHWRTGEVLATPLPDPLPLPHHQMARFYRVHLHQLLISKIPAERIHLGKRVRDVQVRQDDVRVVFEDGSDWVGDAVVGADGIRSAVRKVFYPEYEISSGSSVTLRQVFPSSLLKGIDLPLESCHWPGPDRQLFTSPLRRELFAIVAFIPNRFLPEADLQWGADGSAVNLADFYGDWHPSVAQLARVAPNVKVYPDFNGPALPRLNVGDGRVVLIGDAGHPHGGAFAAGGTLSIEDAYTLALCLDAAQAQSTDHSLNKEGVSFAFGLFNACRVAHVNRLIDAANALRRTRVEREIKHLSDNEILAYVDSHTDIKWLSDNDAEAVFKRTLAKSST